MCAPLLIMLGAKINVIGEIFYHMRKSSPPQMEDATQLKLLALSFAHSRFLINGFSVKKKKKSECACYLK